MAIAINKIAPTITEVQRYAFNRVLGDQHPNNKKWNTFYSSIENTIQTDDLKITNIFLHSYVLNGCSPLQGQRQTARNPTRK